MFCAVNADQYQLVFHRKGRGVVAVEAHANLAREKLFNGEPAREVAQREVVVQFHEQLSVGLGEKILAGNFPGVYGAEGNGGLETRGLQRLRGAADVALTD